MIDDLSMPRDRLRNFFIVSVMVVAAAVVGAGCGKKQSPVPAAITGAPARIEKQGPTLIDGHFGFGQVRTPATGIVDLTDRRLRLDAALAGLGNVTQVVAGGHAYFRLPSTVFRLRKPWIDVDLADPPTSGAAVQMVAISQAGPLSILDDLRGAISATKVGAENVRGRPATHYKVSIDLKRAAANAPASARVAVKLSTDATIKGLGGRTTTTTDVWIGNDGRLLRQVTALVFGGQHFFFDISFLGATNKPITPPPKSLTMSAKQL